MTQFKRNNYTGLNMKACNQMLNTQPLLLLEKHHNVTSVTRTSSLLRWSLRPAVGRIGLNFRFIWFFYPKIVWGMRSNNKRPSKSRPGQEAPPPNRNLDLPLIPEIWMLQYKGPDRRKAAQPQRGLNSMGLWYVAKRNKKIPTHGQRRIQDFVQKIWDRHI